MAPPDDACYRARMKMRFGLVKQQDMTRQGVPFCVAQRREIGVITDQMDCDLNSRRYPPRRSAPG
jgi:hypothetical protein